MGFLRRLFGGNARDKDDLSRLPQRQPPPPGASPGALLDFLEQDRAVVEEVLLRQYSVCPKCQSNYLRVGAWAKSGAAGWTVTCVNCGLMLEKTTAVEVEE